MMKTKIEVDITNLEIDEYNYSFDYTVTMNGKYLGSDTYESDHSWKNDLKGLKEMLMEGEAVKLALEQEL